MRKPHSCANCAPTQRRRLDAARDEMSQQPDMFTLMEQMEQQRVNPPDSPSECPMENSNGQ